MTTRLLAHARHNAVAYLALFVALGGTSYAAVALPRNSVGAAQIKADAVGSAEVKNGTLGKLDFKAGQLPRGARGPAGAAGPSYVALRTQGYGVPATSPDEIGAIPQTVVVATGGKVLVELSLSGLQVTCSAGGADVGVYVDGVLVPGTLVTLSNLQTGGAGPVDLYIPAVTTLSAGSHEVSLGADCQDGDYLVSSYVVGSTLVTRVGAAG